MKKSKMLAASLSLLLLAPGTASAVVVINGSGEITANDPTHNPRIFRDGVASTWAAPKAFPGTFGGTWSYDTANIAFAANAAQTIFYRITHTNLDNTTPHSTAYANFFDPTNVGTNYLGDLGSTPNAGASGVYEVTVAAGSSLVLAMSGANSQTGRYNYLVEAFSDANGGELFGSVPEPSTWMMMLLGFAAAGAAIRKRRKTSILAPA